MPADLKKFGNHLRKIRKPIFSNGREIAKILNIPYSTYNNYEIGISFPPIGVFIKISEILDCSIEVLLSPLLGKSSEEKETIKIMERVRHLLQNSDAKEDLKEYLAFLEQRYLKKRAEGRAG